MEKTQIYSGLGNRFYIFDSLFMAQEAVRYNNENHYAWPIAYAFGQYEIPYGTSKFWNSVAKTPVCLSEACETMLVIQKAGMYWHVIIGEKIGWIIMDGRAQVEKLNDGEK